MSKGVIKKVAGPLVIASGMRDANMFDVVRVSKQRLRRLFRYMRRHPDSDRESRWNPWKCQCP